MRISLLAKSEYEGLTHIILAMKCYGSKKQGKWDKTRSVQADSGLRVQG